jgi:3-deoxy-7-phosphoheptulonate synthase
VIIKMSPKATEPQIRHIVERIAECGCQARLICGEENTVIGVVGNSNQHPTQLEALAGAPGVEEIIPVQHPFKLVSLQFHTERTVVRLAGVQLGGEESVVIAGPCSVESREQILETARAVKEAGAQMLRGGAYKPRTSPYDFQGMGVEALNFLREARETCKIFRCCGASPRSQSRSC